jgi:hypothetical protein
LYDNYDALQNKIDGVSDDYDEDPLADAPMAAAPLAESLMAEVVRRNVANAPVAGPTQASMAERPVTGEVGPTLARDSVNKEKLAKRKHYLSTRSSLNRRLKSPSPSSFGYVHMHPIINSYCNTNT